MHDKLGGNYLSPTTVTRFIFAKALQNRYIADLHCQHMIPIYSILCISDLSYYHKQCSSVFEFTGTVKILCLGQILFSVKLSINLSFIVCNWEILYIQ